MCGAISPALGEPFIVMEPLGGLPGGGAESYANGVSADGTVVVGVASGHGFRWSPGGGIEDFGNSTSDVQASANGAVVIGSYPGQTGGRRAFRWTAATGMVGLGTLPGFRESWPRAMSADGTVVAGYSETRYAYYDEPCEGRIHAFRWTAATGMEDLGVLPGASCSWVTAVSADGKVVVGGSGNGSVGGHAFRWTAEEGLEDLGVLGGYDSFAEAVSADGSVVVGYSRDHPFRWTAKSGMVDLTGRLGFATDVSADGTVVVGHSGLVGTGHARAFRWTAAGGVVNLGVVPGGSESWPSQVSADGAVVVGLSTTDDGDHIFRWSAATGMVDLGILSGGYSWANTVSVDGAMVVGESGGRAFRAYAGRPRIEGTDGADQLMGHASRDVIAGGRGADVMIGLAGNDGYYVGSATDVVMETVHDGFDTVRSLVTYALPDHVERLILLESAAISGTGNALANILIGNSARNTLNGKRGNDLLKGRAGQDRFLFDTVPNGSTNYDTIADFRPRDDTIRLENSVFTGLPAVGTLAVAAFTTGTAATTAAHRIIYDPATGIVRYDADGAGGAPAVHFAVLTTKPVVTSANFYIQ
jgi:probable HAF family extracellular repeat protein